MLSQKRNGGKKFLTQSKSTTYSIYIPCPNDIDNPCAVRLVFDLIKRKFSYRKNDLFVEKNIDFSKLKPAHKLAIFAHPHDDNQGFAYNCLEAKKHLPVNIFQPILFDSSLVYAHVCDGAEVLSNPNNKAVKNWVSYINKISFKFGKPGDFKFFKAFFKNLTNEVKKAKNIDDLEKRIRKTYDNNIDKLTNNYNRENFVLNAIALNYALKSLKVAPKTK